MLGPEINSLMNSPLKLVIRPVMTNATPSPRNAMNMGIVPNKKPNYMFLRNSIQEKEFE